MFLREHGSTGYCQLFSGNKGTPDQIVGIEGTITYSLLLYE